MPETEVEVPRQWWIFHDNVIALISYMAEMEPTNTERIVDAVSTPWSYEDEYREYLAQKDEGD